MKHGEEMGTETEYAGGGGGNIRGEGEMRSADSWAGRRCLGFPEWSQLAIPTLAHAHLLSFPPFLQFYPSLLHFYFIILFLNDNIIEISPLLGVHSRFNYENCENLWINKYFFSFLGRKTKEKEVMNIDSALKGRRHGMITRFYLF